MTEVAPVCGTLDVTAMLHILLGCKEMVFLIVPRLRENTVFDGAKSKSM